MLPSRRHRTHAPRQPQHRAWLDLRSSQRTRVPPAPHSVSSARPLPLPPPPPHYYRFQPARLLPLPPPRLHYYRFHRHRQLATPICPRVDSQGSPRQSRRRGLLHRTASARHDHYRFHFHTTTASSRHDYDRFHHRGCTTIASATTTASRLRRSARSRQPGSPRQPRRRGITTKSPRHRPRSAATPSDHDHG
jgi:hypothetical protein